MIESTGTEGAPISSARRNRVDEVRAKIAEVAASATAADRETVAAILADAAAGHYGFGSKLYDITPGVGALLFMEHNPHNRDWDPSWSLELARRQRMHFWRKNNEVPGFYRDGKLADGQHRLAASALSGVTWTTVIVFGMDRNSITTVDAGRRRDAASALKMDGVRETKLKQTVVKNAASYLVKLGEENAALRSELEIASAIQSNNGVLEIAISIAESSEQNLVNPVLKTSIAATVGYLGLTHGWPEQRVREKLALFQTGQSSAGEQEPFFLAGQIIEKARAKSNAQDKLSTIKEVGLVVHALRLTTQGVRATTKAKMMSAIKTELPKIDYPGEVPMTEAAE
jgi:phenylpyruvate tautomerase PptA (4-oxalocrotonate tautomerase family)